MVKFKQAGPGAAYEIAEGVDAEKAAELGLAVVEVDPTTGAPLRWGRYKDAPAGSPMGITVPKSDDTEVVGGGAVSAPAPEPAEQAPTNPDDLFVQTPPGVETIHADNAPPGEFAEDIPPPEPTKPGKK